MPDLTLPLIAATVFTAGGCASLAAHEILSPSAKSIANNVVRRAASVPPNPAS